MNSQIPDIKGRFLLEYYLFTSHFYHLMTPDMSHDHRVTAHVVSVSAWHQGPVFRVEMSLKFSKNLTAHAHLLTAVVAVVEEMTVCCCLATARILINTVHLIPDHDNYLISAKYPTNHSIFGLNQYSDGSWSQTLKTQRGNVKQNILTRV